MDPLDYISPDEGREEVPIEKPRCGSCGQRVDEVTRCVWDASLVVGKCCETYIDHRCPDCGSDHLRFEEYDFGTCSETGYRDGGVRAICEQCGCHCDERDTEVQIGPKKPAKAELPATYQKGAA